jgi:hypothetical protein
MLVFIFFLFVTIVFNLLYTQNIYIYMYLIFLGKYLF